jgi:hypothetical protein
MCSSANRDLQTSANSHKQVSAELQRTRSALQALRTTHQAELRRREKEAERVVERWAKLSDQQLRAGSLAAGISFSDSKCANAQIRDGSEVVGKGKSFLEVSLEDAERARGELTDENSRLRRTLVRVANEAQLMAHELRLLADEDADPEEASLISLFYQQLMSVLF